MSTTIFFLMVLLTAVEASCDPQDGGDPNKRLALTYKLCSIAAILVAGALGVGLPVLGRALPWMQAERSFFSVIKTFAAGVILATAFIHVLPDGFESLTSPCLPEKPWGDFPFAGFVAMVSAIGTLMVDTYATAYYNEQSQAKDEEGAPTDEEAQPTDATHGHAAETDRHRVISQVLELGVIFHSVIIGVALGASQSPKTIKPLIAALSFHQFFEGIGLGGCITQARFSLRAALMMALFFSLTTPVGIAIGIGISHFYSETSVKALVVEGVFNSASAGILIYMALVDLLAAEFMSSKLQTNKKLMLAGNVSLLIGAGCMSLLAKWA